MDINSYLVPGKRAHLAGIGGVSMSPLAEVLHSMGLSVQGSDMNDSPAVEHLRALGIPVAIGHAADNLGDADFVVRTAAIHDDNPEISGAVARGIPVFERAQAWGAIMHGYRNALCISGTHGKTTTTSMATHIFMAADTDPTVMIGGTLPLLHSGYRVGHGDTIIAESCEYCNSFLSFFPTVAVILNVEADHLDFFKDLHDVEHSFRRFAELVPADGHVVANWDDAGVRETLEGYTGSLFTFSERGADAHCHAENLVYTNGLPSFDVICMGQKYAHVALEVGGEHNVMNALAAASAAYVLGIRGEAVERGLATFTGAGRRPALNKLLTEAENNFCAYALGGGHRHTPEIEQNIAYITGKDLMKPETWQYINFQPHLLPQVRGIEVTIYATCDKDFTNEEVYELYKDFYKDEPFVKVFPASLPVQTKWAYGTNFVEMTPTFDSRTHRLIVSSVIDNIGKGAAGQAIQNMNLIMGIPETTGLMMPPMYP